MISSESSFLRTFSTDTGLTIALIINPGEKSKSYRRDHSEVTIH